MFKPLMHYAKALAALWELSFPKPDKITWLEKQALMGCGKARIATLAEDGELIAFVSEIYSRDGAKTPKIIIYDSPKNNAMHLNNNTLCISTAKLQETDRQGLEATIAHEYAHQKQNAVSLGIMIGRMLGIIALANWATNKSKPYLEKTGAFFSTAAVATFTACSTALHYLTELPWKAYRRWQELDADTCSVKLTGSPEGMIKNLEGHARKKAEKDAEKGIAEPQGFKKTWQELNREHPSHEERIAHLRKEAEHRYIKA